MGMIFGGAATAIVGVIGAGLSIQYNFESPTPVGPVPVAVGLFLTAIGLILFTAGVAKY